MRYEKRVLLPVGVSGNRCPVIAIDKSARLSREEYRDNESQVRHELSGLISRGLRFWYEEEPT